MTTRYLYVRGALTVLFGALPAVAGLWAQEAPPADSTTPAPEAATAPVPAAGVDRIELTDGSVVLGKIVGLAGGALRVETAFGVGEVVEIKLDQVEKVQAENPHVWVTADGQRLRGTASSDASGKITIQSAGNQGGITTDISNLSAIDPAAKKDVRLVGFVNLGVTINDGNTQTKAANFNAEAVARSDRQRLTLRAAWNYAQDSTSGITARNTKGSIKYDFFLTERVFLFASALFEEDKFQNLNLRTALSGGPGFQFVKPGDFKSEMFKDLDVYGEVGLAFFNEDFRTGADSRYVSARWSAKVDWPIASDVIIFHFHEVYPGLKRARDLYVSTEQGVRFKFWSNFTASIQVNWRWDNTPSPGFERSDTIYLVTLGYNFDV